MPGKGEDLTTKNLGAPRPPPQEKKKESADSEKKVKNVKGNIAEKEKGKGKRRLGLTKRGNKRRRLEKKRATFAMKAAKRVPPREARPWGGKERDESGHPATGGKTRRSTARKKDRHL